MKFTLESNVYTTLLYNRTVPKSTYSAEIFSDNLSIAPLNLTAAANGIEMSNIH